LWKKIGKIKLEVDDVWTTIPGWSNGRINATRV
jgi:hypothetical protein